MENENRPLVGVGLVIIENGNTLLAKRKGAHAQGFWGSCGGHLETGETVESALKREAKEELGIDIEIVKFLCCINMVKHGKHYVDLTFLAKIKNGRPKIMEPEKVESIEWHPIEGLPENVFEPVKFGIESYRTGKVFYEVIG